MNQPARIKLLRNEPLVCENGHGKYFMLAVKNEAHEEFVWFASSPAHEAIKSQELVARKS